MAQLKAVLKGFVGGFNAEDAQCTGGYLQGHKPTLYCIKH